MNNIRQLYALHPERRAALTKFSSDQANFWMRQVVNPEGAAAALNMVVTGDNRIETKLCAVEPEHAAVLLAELDSVRAKLCQFLIDQAPELLDRVSAPANPSANVIAFRGTASC